MTRRKEVFAHETDPAIRDLRVSLDVRLPVPAQVRSRSAARRPARLHMQEEARMTGLSRADLVRRQRQVRCFACGASPLESCRDKNGRKMGGVHKIRAARAKRTGMDTIDADPRQIGKYK